MNRGNMQPKRSLRKQRCDGAIVFLNNPKSVTPAHNPQPKLKLHPRTGRFLSMLLSRRSDGCRKCGREPERKCSSPEWNRGKSGQDDLGALRDSELQGSG
ncbi:unnamed protein product [Symbiodinium sp. CCMP2456]|nr:unnamed protein product [Symbiodinium sp. CCMP2456]